MKRCSRCQTEYDDSFTSCPKDGGRLEEETVVVPIPTEATHAVPGDPLIGRTIADRFKIECKLGEGGMGSVYKAEHVRMNRPCAIKILNAAALNEPDSLARFNREAQMSSRIDHQHAVTIYDYGESEEGLVYLAMEFIEGETLTDVLDRSIRFPPDRAMNVAGQIAQALDAAHALAIVHRDLKPDNIMLTRKGKDDDFVKVLDFGIAKMTEGEEGKRNDLTQAGLIIGTPVYMSPEQVAGETLDPRSDVYSFALIVYEMLAGRLPFDGQNTQAIMVNRLTTDPKPIRQLNPQLSEHVEVAVMRGLARDRDRRTPTAGQLIADLQAAVSGNAVRGATDNRPSANTVPVHPPTMAIGAQTPPPVSQPGGQPTLAQSHHPPSLLPTEQAPRAPDGEQTWGVVQSPGYQPQPVAAPGVGPHTPMPYTPPPAKKGGAGIFIGLFLVLLLFGAVAAVGVLGYTQGWFTSGTSDDPDAPRTAERSGTDDADSAYAVYEEGFRLHQKGDIEGAIRKYREAIAMRDPFPQAHANLGAALVDREKYQEAVRELGIAIEQDPSPKGEVYFNQGMAYLKLANYERSAEAFEKALARDEEPLAHAYRGFALDNAGDTAGAKREYERYLSKEPDGQAAPKIRAILEGREKAPKGEDL